MDLTIGTRQSRLAIAQTTMIKKAIENIFSDVNVRIRYFVTEGDRRADLPLIKIGGKGVFVSEIENALQNGEIDAAVHSAKDLPLKLADRLELSCVLPRGDSRDMLIFSEKIYKKNEKFTVGTGSQRRRNNLLKIYPYAEFLDIRGNIDTRLKKLNDGKYDAIILCAAGIERLDTDMSNFHCIPLELREFVPAPCQGIIAAECVKNSPAAKLLKKVSDENTMFCCQTEREIIRLLNADCTSPLGAYSVIDGDKIKVTISDGYEKKICGECNIDKRYILAKELAEKI